MCGYHPWADLHELFLDHLYQDRRLRALDAAAVGLRLVRRDEEVEQLLSEAHRRGGSDARAAAALSAVLQSGASTQTVAGVARLGEAASGLIAGMTGVGASARTVLECGVRSALNTDFGTRHEAEALGLYERSSGGSVRGSNDALYSWRFPPQLGAPPQPVTILPPRRRRPRPLARGGSPCGRASGGCCGCGRLRAIDRARAAAAVARGEVRWHLRMLRALDGRAAPSDYLHDGVWDAAGLMSDLRISRGRRLLRLL